MGNERNRKRKRPGISPSKLAKKFKDGEPHKKEAGPEAGLSGAKIGTETEHFDIHSENVDTIREGTIFMGVSILFGVIDAFLKCPDCGHDVNSHVDVRKKHG